MLARHIALAPGSSRRRHHAQEVFDDSDGNLYEDFPAACTDSCLPFEQTALNCEGSDDQTLAQAAACLCTEESLQQYETCSSRLHQLGQYRNQTSYTIQQLALSIATYCGRNVSFDGEPASLSPAIAAQQTDPDVLSFRSALSTNTMLDQQTISFSADATISLEPTSVSRSVTSTSSAPVTSSASATSRTATLISSSSSSSAAPSASQTGAASSSLVRLGAGSLFGAVGVAALLV
ncbi:hypothetical protein JCM8547_004606 [Rhodosporidiobolus lusitaniae]